MIPMLYLDAARALLRDRCLPGSPEERAARIDAYEALVKREALDGGHSRESLRVVAADAARIGADGRVDRVAYNFACAVYAAVPA